MFPHLEQLRRERAASLAAMDQAAEERRQRVAAIVSAMERDIRQRQRGRRINNVILPPGVVTPAPPSKTPGGMATWR